MNSLFSNKFQLFSVTLVILTAITWSIGLLDIQFKAETTLAFDNGFPGETQKWKLAGDPGNITISNQSVRITRNSANHSYAMRQFALPPGNELLDRQLRVRGVISTVKQASRSKIEDVAAYMIWFNDQNDKTIQYTTVQALTGDFPEYRAERIVRVPDNAHSLITVLINRESDGTFELSDANVSLVKTTLFYQIISPLVFVLWLLLIVVAVVWLIVKGGITVGLSIGLFIMLTLIGVLIPDSVTSDIIFPAYKKIATTLSLGHSEPLGIYYKLGHFLFFFAVSLTLIINRHKLQFSVLTISFLMLVFAVATEGLQLHLYNRSTRLSDIGIDMLGVLLAIFLGFFLEYRQVKPIRTGTEKAD